MQELKGLYVIADAECIGSENIINKTEEVLAAGVKIIQYRDKVNSRSDRNTIGTELMKLTNKHACLLLVNDDAELAATINADGVHLGQNDISIPQARAILEKEKIIGASCYATLENAQHAVEAGANYIAFGSFYPSTTKPTAPRAEMKLLKRAKQDYSIPVCAIGGITPDNAATLIEAGADMVAVISSVFNASSPTHAVQEYLSSI